MKCDAGSTLESREFVSAGTVLRDASPPLVHFRKRRASLGGHACEDVNEMASRFSTSRVLKALVQRLPVMGAQIGGPDEIDTRRLASQPVVGGASFRETLA